MLPEYTGTTDGDRANYLFENADQLAAEAVASARQRIEKARIKGILIFTSAQADDMSNSLCETIPEAAKFMSDLQRADEMAETRDERVGVIADEVFTEEA